MSDERKTVLMFCLFLAVGLPLVVWATYNLVKAKHEEERQLRLEYYRRAISTSPAVPTSTAK